MRNRLREMIDESFQGLPISADPDGHEIAWTLVGDDGEARCRTMTELAKKFKNPDSPAGHLSIAQVSRLINNPHRKFKEPHYGDVLYWQTSYVTGMERDEFDRALELDSLERDDLQEVDTNRVKIQGLEREVNHLRDQLSKISKQFEDSQEGFRKMSRDIAEQFEPLRAMTLELNEQLRTAIEETRKSSRSWAELYRDAKASQEEDGESNAA